MSDAPFRVDNIRIVFDVYHPTLGRNLIKFDYAPSGQDDPLLVAAIEKWRADARSNGPNDPFVVI